MPKITVYISPDGKRHFSLPRLWNNTSPITEPWALAHGWSKHEEEIPEPTAPPRRYSKLKLVRELKSLGIWDTVRNAIVSADAWDEWLVCQELSDDDPMFQSLIPAATALLPESINIQEVLEQCEI